MRIVFIIILLFAAMQLPGQILKQLKNNALQKTMTTVKTSVKSKIKNELDGVRAEFDSTDFDYALLLSDNSGFYGQKDKTSYAGKFLTLGSLGSSLKKDADFTDEEWARFHLETGQASYAMGRFVFAEDRFKNARSIYERLNLTNGLGYLKTISNLGLLYTTMGRFTQAEKITSDALASRQTKFGANDMGIAALLNNYAVLHYDLGKYSQSEKEFAAAASVIHTNKLQNSMPYAIVLNNQAMLFQSIGRYPEAIKLLYETISIAGNAENGKTKNLLKFSSNLALLYQLMNKYEDAENIYLSMEKSFDKSKPEYANMLNNMAALYLVMNKLDKVEEMLKKAASIYKSHFGETSPAYAKAISDLGNFYRYQGRYTDARPLLEQALKIRELVLGPNHPVFVQSEEDMAILFWKIKEVEKSYELYHDVMEKSLGFINSYFIPMSETEKAKYWDILFPRFQRFYNFAIETSSANKQVIVDLLEYRLATKGLLLSSVRKVSESILAGGNEQTIKDYALWIDRKEELARLFAYSKAELKEQNINLDSLESATNALEKKLSENSSEFNRFFFTAKTKYTEIQSGLKPGDALIEIVRLRKYDNTFTNDTWYIGLVITKSNQQPQLVIFDKGAEMEAGYAKSYRMAMKNRLPDEQSYTRYWAPFDPALKDIKKIYVSLDGVYNQVSLNTLKKPGGDYLVNQYDIILLGNGKDVLIHNARSSAPVKNATLIGFPDYGTEKIPPLPATKIEIDGISKVLQSSGFRVQKFEQKDATESNLKLAKEVLVLHIATHGYFLKDVENISWPIGVHSDNAKDNVLLRSGLILAGAPIQNEQTQTLDNISNGVITSYEAMNLDLKGTSLVVLSACETGLGEIKSGEGVYGLQRAFLAAGADAIIMSLWKVDDAATQQLMNYFYANWVKTGDKQKAFKQAQLQLMTKFKEPFYWGPFVMMEN